MVCTVEKVIGQFSLVLLIGNNSRKLFLEITLLQEWRKVKVEEFINLKKDNMSVKDYSLKFCMLSNILHPLCLTVGMR